MGSFPFPPPFSHPPHFLRHQVLSPLSPEPLCCCHCFFLGPNLWYLGLLSQFTDQFPYSQSVFLPVYLPLYCQTDVSNTQIWSSRFPALDASIMFTLFRVKFKHSPAVHKPHHGLAPLIPFPIGMGPFQVLNSCTNLRKQKFVGKDLQPNGYLLLKLSPASPLDHVCGSSSSLPTCRSSHRHLALIMQIFGSSSVMGRFFCACMPSNFMSLPLGIPSCCLRPAKDNLSFKT